MTQKEFLNNVANAQEDILQLFLNLVHENEIDYCVIGGLAVNAYVEPLVSLDLDIVVAAKEIDKLVNEAKGFFTIKEFEHSLNLNNKKSDLRIQIQTDPRYQAFMADADFKNVMGYEMKVASVENVLRGKIWAYSDVHRRKSKRQKDLTDIFRLMEEFPHLKNLQEFVDSNIRLED